MRERGSGGREDQACGEGELEILDIARDLSFHDSFTVTEMAMRHERAENVEHNATGKLGGIVVHIVGGETSTTSMPHKPSAAIV